MLGFTKLFWNNSPTTPSAFAAAFHISTTEPPSKECSLANTTTLSIPVEALNGKMTLENVTVHDLAKLRHLA